jgi:transcription-repair coupling factor (superfamily II helicase)
LKTDVHVLTLTATPIPRTLQMAMSGLRELSVIQTPPVDRLAVRTYVMPWDGVVIREALLREHYRGGQSFFVVPRISDIADIEEFMAQQVPEVKASSRMARWARAKWKSACPPSTTANTTCCSPPPSSKRAGYSQRQHPHHPPRRPFRPGPALSAARPGRPVQDPRLCLFHHARQIVSSPRRRKSGSRCCPISIRWARAFQLASHDLDIRGAGNLVGDEQSGHIKEVGFELYQSMLEEAILDAKAGGSLDFEAARRLLAPDHRRCADHDPGGLCARSRSAHGPLSPPQRS